MHCAHILAYYDYLQSKLERLGIHHQSIAWHLAYYLRNVPEYNPFDYPGPFANE